MGALTAWPGLADYEGVPRPSLECVHWLGRNATQSACELAQPRGLTLLGSAFLEFGTRADSRLGKEHAADLVGEWVKQQELWSASLKLADACNCIDDLARSTPRTLMVSLSGSRNFLSWNSCNSSISMRCARCPSSALLHSEPDSDACRAQVRLGFRGVRSRQCKAVLCSTATPDSAACNSPSGARVI